MGKGLLGGSGGATGISKVHFKGSGWYSTSNRTSGSQSKSKTSKDNSKKDKKSAAKNKSNKSKKTD